MKLIVGGLNMDFDQLGFDMAVHEFDEIISVGKLI